MKRWKVYITDCILQTWDHEVVGENFTQALVQAQLWWKSVDMDWDCIVDLHIHETL